MTSQAMGPDGITYGLTRVRPQTLQYTEVSEEKNESLKETES